MVQGDSVWHWLSVAQRYGLPARLMDRNVSPCAALPLATADLDHDEGDQANITERVLFSGLESLIVWLSRL